MNRELSVLPKNQSILIVCLTAFAMIAFATASHAVCDSKASTGEIYENAWVSEVVEANSCRSEADSEIVVPQTIRNVEQTFEQGVRVSKNEVNVVNLHGTWYEMGRQYGMLLKPELEEVHAFVRALIKNNEAVAEEIINVQRRQTPYRILSFMRGASETSGLTIEEMQEVNAVERIGGLPKCSAAFCWGAYSGGTMVIGRNYDYSAAFSQLKNDVVVTVYHPADSALAVATIGYVGEIYAVNGLNEKGIFMELNNGTPSTNIKTQNMRITGTTTLFSMLFETDELEDWELFFNTTCCNSSYIINVADSQKAVSYEWCQVGVKTGGADLPEGLVVSTNYYVNPDWLFKVPSDNACWHGQTRRSNLTNLCESSKGKIDAQKMMEIVGTSMENGGAMNELTVYQMVVIPETKTLWLRVIGGSDWLHIDLSRFLQG